MQKILSIIIPVYNVEQYIEECLNSIPTSCSDDIEIIVVEDCSTDNSKALVEQFIDNNAFDIKIIQHEINKGLGIARNTGIKVSSGKYLMFIDSDDYLCEGTLEKLIDVAREENSDIILGNYIEIKNGVTNEIKGKYNTNFNSLPLDEALDNVIHSYEPVVWKNIYKRVFILDNNLLFSDLRFQEDADWTPVVFLKTSSFRYIDLTWYAYRIREGSITQTYLPRNDFCRLQVASKLYKLASESTNDKFKKRFFKIANRYYRISLRPNEKQNKEDRKKIYEICEKISYIMKNPKTIKNLVRYYFIKIAGVKNYAIVNSFFSKSR